MSASIIALFQAYDDDALKTYANAGLLRRAKKDVTADKVSITEQTADAIRLLSDGQNVVLTQSGLTDAQCDCSAVSACKHIVASVLFLQTASLQTTDSQVTASESVNDTSNTSSDNNQNDLSQKSHSDDSERSEKSSLVEPSQTARSEILTYSIEDFKGIAKKIPKAKRLNFFHRAYAFCFAEQTNQEDVILGDLVTQSVITDDGISINITLANQPLPIRYIAGAGVAGMLSKIDKENTAVEKQCCHLLALLVVQLVYGENTHRTAIFLWLKQVIADTQPSTTSAQHRAVLSASAMLMLDDLYADIAQLMAQGLGNIEQVNNDNAGVKSYWVNRLHLHNILAKAEYLPRLATLLRQLSGLLDAYIRGENHASSRHILMQLAEVYAFVEQLKHAPPATLPMLRGKLRQSYDVDEKRPDIRLYPLSAHWWQSTGKARGLTLYFYESTEQSIVEFTQARAQGQDPNFSMLSAWHQLVWQSSAKALMSQISMLNNPRFKDKFRINAHDSLAVTGSRVTQSSALADNYADYLQTVSHISHDNWQALTQNWQQQLTEDDRLQDTVVLTPSKVGGLLLDDIEQCVWWELFDADNSCLRLRLDWKNTAYDTIAIIKNLENIPTEHIKMVVARVSMSVQDNVITLTPLSLTLKDKLFNLAFDVVETKKRTLKELLTNRVKKLVATKKRETKQRGTKQRETKRETKQNTIHQDICTLIGDPIMDTLVAMATSGRYRLTQNQEKTLRQQQKLAQDAGLTLIANQLDSLWGGAELQPSSQNKNMLAQFELLKTVFMVSSLKKLGVVFPV